MAKDFTNDISFYLSLKLLQKKHLGAIRIWQNLKIGFDGDTIWLKDLTFEQTQSVEVNSIPYKKIYYTQGGKLFLQNSLLPSQNIPSLLWTPIERGLPVTLPDFNHNYFGNEQKVNIQLIATEQEQEAIAMITSLENLRLFVENAPAIRLQNLKWIIIDNINAIVLGSPVLPIRGEMFWRDDNFLIPVGFDFDLSILKQSLAKLINPNQENWVVWQADGTYFLIPKNTFNQLSISSFRAH